MPAGRNVTGVTSVPSSQPGVEPGEQPERHPGLRDRLPGPADLRDLDQVVHQREPGEPGLVGGERHAGSQAGRVLAPREPGHLEHDLAGPASCAGRVRGSCAVRSATALAAHGRRLAAVDLVHDVPALGGELVGDGAHPLELAGQDRRRDRHGRAAALRRRHSASGVSNTTATAGQAGGPGGRQPARPALRRRGRGCRPPW